jgi:A1 cistron-splicing factor AAR2
MDQKLANKLFEEGAFLFLLGVPIGTEVGIDFNSWRTGEKFKGIKMIPPGIHYIYYRQIRNKLFLLEQLCECKIHCDVKNVIVCFYIISSSVSKEGSVAPRTGFFYNFKKKEVVVRKWNPEIEDVVNNCNFIL